MSRNRNSVVTKELTRQEKDYALVQELRDFHHFAAARRLEELLRGFYTSSGSGATSSDSNA